jgi:hypothetical protein
MPRLSIKRVAELSLLVTTIALTLMSDGSHKDLAISIGICLSVFTSSHRSFRRTYSNQPEDVAHRHSRASSTLTNNVLSLLVAVGLTIALTMLPDAPKLYLFVAAAPAMYFTFNPVTSRIFPASLSIACTGLLVFTVFMWPNQLCGVGLLYVSFVSQILESVVLNRFVASLLFNLIVIFLEFQTDLFDGGLLPLLDGRAGSGGGGFGGDGVDSGGSGDTVPVAYVWKSLKDVAVVGTLFPVLISFDLRKLRTKKVHSGSEGYFFTAISTFSLSLIGMTAVHAMELTTDHPLCLTTSTPVLVAVLLRALVQGDLINLLRFDASNSRERLD